MNEALDLTTGGLCMVAAAANHAADSEGLEADLERKHAKARRGLAGLNIRPMAEETHVLADVSILEHLGPVSQDLFLAVGVCVPGS